MRHRIPSWLHNQSKLWKILGSVSAITGLVSYALSSSFKHLFGQWNFHKFLLYILISLLTSLIVLYAKRIPVSRSFMLKAHGVFFTFLLISVYSLFYDKSAVTGEPDPLSLISYSSFALMSLSMSRKLELGFETGLFNFFLGCLTVQLMKINWFLSLIAVVFSYVLINFRCYLDSHMEIGPTGKEDHVELVIENAQVSGESIASEEDDNISSLSSQVEPLNQDMFGDNQQDSEENKSWSSLIFQTETTNKDDVSSGNNMATKSISQNSEAKQGSKLRAKESKSTSRELASAINDGIYFYEQDLKNRGTNHRKNNSDRRERKLKSKRNNRGGSNINVEENISGSESSSSGSKSSRSESRMEQEEEEPMIQIFRSNRRGRINKKPS